MRMPLSEDDRRRLNEIEQSLTRDDPQFAARVNVQWRRRRRLLGAIACFAVGAVLLIAGLVHSCRDRHRGDHRGCRSRGDGRRRRGPAVRAAAAATLNERVVAGFSGPGWRVRRSDPRARRASARCGGSPGGVDPLVAAVLTVGMVVLLRIVEPVPLGAAHLGSPDTGQSRRSRRLHGSPDVDAGRLAAPSHDTARPGRGWRGFRGAVPAAARHGRSPTPVADR